MCIINIYTWTKFIHGPNACALCVSQIEGVNVLFEVNTKEDIKKRGRGVTVLFFTIRGDSITPPFFLDRSIFTFVLLLLSGFI